MWHPLMPLMTLREATPARVVRVSDMPKLPQPIIEVAWRHSGEVGKIHYRAKRPDGSNRHLIVREGEALYELLEQHLKAIDYSGPKSSAEGTSEH